MKKNNEHNIKELIDDLINTYKLRTKINEVRLQHLWKDIAGNSVAARTIEIYIKDKTLFLRLTSAPLKEELFYAREKIIQQINKRLEGDFIKEIKFISAALVLMFDF